MYVLAARVNAARSSREHAKVQLCEIRAKISRMPLEYQNNSKHARARARTRARTRFHTRHMHRGYKNKYFANFVFLRRRGQRGLARPRELCAAPSGTRGTESLLITASRKSTPRFSHFKREGERERERERAAFAKELFLAGLRGKKDRDKDAWIPRIA